MNKDPAFLFYSSDFLVGTMLMSNEEVGKYIRLMCLAHQKGGYLTKEDMFKICNENDKDVLNKFNVDDEGVYYNERLLSEITKRKKYSDSRSNNRKGKKEEKEQDMSDICKSYDEHMENENEDINNNDISSLKENNNKVKRFVKPNIDEIIEYIHLENLSIDPNTFFDYYESNGWVVGKNKMKDWKATLRNWHRKNFTTKTKKFDIMDL